MTDIKYVTEGSKTEVYSPYNPEFVREIKAQLGTRKFDGQKKCWVINTDDLDIVKNIVKEVYGYTDADTEMVTVKITFTESVYVEQDALRLNGFPLVKATGRDSGAKPCNDVTLLKGDIDSGGSVRYWETHVENGTVLKVRMPKALATNPDARLNTYYESDSVAFQTEILEDQPINKEELEAEKEKLLARLAEIEKLLGEEDEK